MGVCGQQGIGALRVWGVYALGLAAVEPERGGSVVDRDLPDGELGRGSVDELEAGVDAGHRAGGVRDVGAGRGEGGLGDGVVLVQELELDDVTIGNTRETAIMSLGDDLDE